MILKVFGKAFQFISKVYNRFLMICYRPLFRSHGRNFIFDPHSIFSFDSIEIGDDVFIGKGAYFVGLKGIFIGNKVMFGPFVSILGGNHNTSLVGVPMIDVKTKRPEDDLPVYIEDDTWIGSHAIIMKGVRVKTGSIVAAGSIVTKDVESYTIVAGIPAIFVKFRFEEETLKEHIKRISNDL